MNVRKRMILWDGRYISRDEFVEKYKNNPTMMDRLRKVEAHLLKCFNTNYHSDFCNDCVCYPVCSAEEKEEGE